VYIDSTLADRVLSTTGRHYSADVSSRTAHRQVPALHHGARVAVNHCHRGRVERSFSQPVDTHHGAVGSANVPSTASSPPVHAATLH